MVGRCRLAGEEKDPRRHFEIRVFAQSIVEYHDAQRVQQLSLIFVDTLDLTIEDRVGVNGLTRRCLKPVGKLQLGRAFGVAEGLSKSSVIGEWLDFAQLAGRSIVQRNANGFWLIALEKPSGSRAAASAAA